MLIVLPGPFAGRIEALDVTGEVRFKLRDAGHGDCFRELTEYAAQHGMALELRLVHYEGQKDMPDQLRARRERKRTGEKLTVREGGRAMATELLPLDG